MKEKHNEHQQPRRHRRRTRASRTPTSRASSRRPSRRSSALTPTASCSRIWIGPRSLETKITHWDFRTGGGYRYEQTDADGNTYAFRGVFHTVRENELLIQTFEYEGTPDEVSIDIMRFESLPGGRSRIVDHSVFPSIEVLEGMMAEGMEYGMNEGYEKLDEMLAAGADMGIVVSSASTSLDGFVAYPNNDPGPLFDWYEAGDVEIVNAGDLPPFHLTKESADYWTGWVSELGCLVVGRLLFDITDGWKGEHPLGVPFVVVTHEAPTDWAYARPATRTSSRRGSRRRSRGPRRSPATSPSASPPARSPARRSRRGSSTRSRSTSCRSCSARGIRISRMSRRRRSGSATRPSSSASKRVTHLRFPVLK